MQKPKISNKIAKQQGHRPQTHIYLTLYKEFTSISLHRPRLFCRRPENFIEKAMPLSMQPTSLVPLTVLHINIQHNPHSTVDLNPLYPIFKKALTRYRLKFMGVINR